jgi:hypothetical protein
MADTNKILGQSAPGATTPTTLYTVPAATSTTVSSIVVCNRGGSATTFRISLAPGGAGDATSQYLYYDVAIAGNDTFAFTGGLTLATTDLIRVYAGNANLTFSVYGVEVT